jgi:hypothetical protein
LIYVDLSHPVKEIWEFMVSGKKLPNFGLIAIALRRKLERIYTG